MALQVWLPLTKDLRNQGLSNVTVTNNGATYASTGGKLGGCYTFDGNDYIRISMPSSMTTILGCTVAAWVKSTSSTLALGGISQDLSNYTAPCVTLYTSGWQFTSTARSGYGYVSGGTVANTSVWHHVVCTVDDSGNIKTYLNGAQVASSSLTTLNVNANTAITSSNFIEIGCDHPGGDEYLTGSVNDFRIYDHCLTPEEVKRLAQGLVLHYPLNNGGFGAENLILESKFVTGGGAANGITRSYASDGSLKVVAASGNGNYCSVNFAKDSNSNVGAKLTIGDTYTISCKCKIESGTALPTLFINSGNAYKQLNGDKTLNQWHTISYTSTWADPGSGYGNIALHLGFSNAIGTYYFKEFKLEKSPSVTPWCPAPGDANNLGVNSTTEYDCSGFCNNGTRSGTFSWTSDTPKYAVSTKFPASPYITSNNTIGGGLKTMTMACWIKPTTLDSTWRRICGIGAHTRAHLDITSSNAVRFFVSLDGTSGTYIGATSSIILTTNTWYHVCGVLDENVVKIYVNGELQTTSSTGTITYTNADTFRVGTIDSGSLFDGQISDCRIYATALSATDVKSLYQNCATIGPDGTIYGKIR